MSGLARFTRHTDAGRPGGDTGRRRAPDDPLADVDPSLRRFLGPRQQPAPGEACELCGAPMGDDHRHVVDLDQRGILCTCRPCGLLFTGGAEAHDHFRTVPDRYLHVDPFHLTAAQWASLQIPVGVAFVVDNSQLGGPVAFYPSPGGATESELALTAWHDIVAANPALEDMEPDVEAALVRNAGATGPARILDGDAEPVCHVVPVDRCYELVGRLRLHWRGFDGGQEVREALTEFLDDVAARSRPARRRTA